MNIDEIKIYLGDKKRGLVGELFNAINEYCFYTVINKAHENNRNLELSTNNPWFANFLQRGYSITQIITIGRLIDDSPKAVSLKRIIIELNKISSIDKDKLRDLLNIIKKNKSLKIIGRDRHKLIAHLDKENFLTPINTKLEDIEKAVVTLAYIAKELSYITSQTIETFSWYPTPNNKKLFINLDKPFFFPEEIEKLTEHFLKLQDEFDEKIKQMATTTLTSC